MRKQNEEKKSVVDTVIDAAAIIALITMFLGAMVGIWVGTIGIKILLTGMVLLIADYITVKLRVIFNQIKENQTK